MMKLNNNLGTKINWWKWLCIFLCGIVVLILIYSFPLALVAQADNFIITILFCLLGVFFLLVVYQRLFTAFEHRETIEIKWTPRPFLYGVGVAVLIFALFIASCLAFGDGVIEYRGISIEHAIRSALFLMLAAMGEEIVFRGVVFRMIAYQIGFSPGIIISSFLFGFSHLPNPSSTIWCALAVSLGVGCYLALLLAYSGSLWASIGFHWAWNYVEGIILGMPVSGLTMDISVFALSGIPTNLVWGDSYGPESSLLMLCITIIVSITTVILYSKSRVLSCDSFLNVL